MKKLHLLKPEVKYYFLNEGKGEKVTYLRIDKKLTKACLDADVEAGAKHLKELKSLEDKTEGDISRVVILRGDNEENLYMAATYLAALRNEKKGTNADMYDDDWDQGEEEGFVKEYEEDDCDDYFESPYKVPLIEMDELMRFGTNNNFSFLAMII